MPQLIEVPGVGQVEFPDGMSDQDIVKAIQSNQQPKPQMTTIQRLMAGMVDPIQGGAQLLENAVRAISPRAVDAINAANNKMADVGIVGRLPAGGVDQQTKERERALKTDSMDWPRMIGNVLSPVSLMAAPARGATLGAQVLQGAGTGAVAAGMMPNEGDAGDKLGQMALGAVGGGVAPAAVRGVSRMISPKASTDAGVQLLQNEGVRPTIGQTLGGKFNAVEEKLMSVPILGDAIGNARARAGADLNVAVGNRALAPIGQTMPKNLTGREAVDFVEKRLGDAYESLLPNLTARADQQFAQQIGGLRQMVNTGAMDPNAAKTFNRILQNDVLGKFRGQNALTGPTIKAIESDLTSQINRFAASTDADQRLVADALEETRSALRGLLTRNNPQAADELKAINTGWANFKRMQRAASYVGSEDGAFTASQLQSAIKGADRSKDKGAFARGNALMQDLSDPAKRVLGGKVPNSGTADRALMAALPTMMFDPTIGASIASGSLLYSAPAQGLLRGAVSRRPGLAQPIAGLLNQSAPMLSPAGGLLALDVFE